MATKPQKKFLTYSIRDFYKDYSRACTKEKRKPNGFPKRDYIKYRNYIWDVFAEIFHKIMYDSWHFVLPYSLGEFYIKEIRKVAGQRTYSKLESMRAGKAVFIFNNHTLRKLFKFVWDKSYASFPTAKYYKFRFIEGRDKCHKERKVGKEALSKHYFEMGTNPKLKVPSPYNKAVRFLQEPNYEQQ